MIHRFAIHAADPGDPAIQRQRDALGLPDLDAWLDYYIEFYSRPTADERALIGDALCQVGTTMLVDEPFGDNTVAVLHRRGVVDNENGSIMAVCDLLGLRAKAAKLARCYRSASPRLREVIESVRFNSAIEDVHVTEPQFDTLVPVGAYAPAEHFDLRSRSDEELEALGRDGGRNLSRDHMRRVQEIQKALGLETVTDTLLEALDARWSDHCAHTTWKSLGSLLDRLVSAAEDTANPNILSMFHDNAGVWDFYDGHALALKAETHNGPSAISAYFGQLTKLGGVLRDILGTGLGADPFGSFEYTATGLPGEPPAIAGRPDARQIAHDTVQAIKEYGNTFGVPMAWSRMEFHPGYRAKPFALGGSVGVLPVSAAQRGRPQSGDLVVLIGGLTGNEGMHGASASSAGSQMDVAAVQIGAPLEQVKFRKALIDLRDAGLLRALTDIGGAGLNSAVGEIGDPSGIWINTALVPLKTSAMPMWRILLSESQERMLLAVPMKSYPAAWEILDRHMVRTTVIGRFTDSGRYCVLHAPELDEAAVIALPAGAVPLDAGELGFDVPYDLLGLPVTQYEVGPVPVAGTPTGEWPKASPSEVASAVREAAASIDVASQWYADSQYDSTVQGNTVHGPQYGRAEQVSAGYWAASPVPDNPAAAVLTTAFNPWLFDLHPVRALRQNFVALLGAQVLAGVELADVCVCDNFYTPHLSKHWREWLVGMVDELAALVRHFGTPVISGKDSSAGSTKTDDGVVSVPPAAFLTGLGKVSDAAGLLGETWTRPGSVLVRVGIPTPAPAGTVAARMRGLDSDGLDDVPLDEASRYLAALRESRALFLSGTRLGAGGLGTQAVVGALASGLGVEIDPALADFTSLLAEHRCCALVEVDASDVGGLPPDLHPMVVGRLTSDGRVTLCGEDLLTDEVRQAWTSAFAEALA